MREPPLRRYDFPASKFPITIEALHPESREVVWSKVLEQPADAALVHIPPLARMFGHAIEIRIRYGDGEVQEETPE